MGGGTIEWTGDGLYSNIGNNNNYSSNKYIINAIANGYFVGWTATDFSSPFNPAFEIAENKSFTVSNGGAACIQSFTGPWTGSGNFIFSTDTVNASAAQGQTYAFLGDMSGFSGNITRSVVSGTPTFSTSLTGKTGILQFGSTDSTGSTKVTIPAQNGSVSGTGAITTAGLLRYEYGSDKGTLSIGNSSISAKLLDFTGGANYMVTSTTVAGTGDGSKLRVNEGTTSISSSVSGFGGGTEVISGATLALSSANNTLGTVTGAGTIDLGSTGALTNPTWGSGWAGTVRLSNRTDNGNALDISNYANENSKIELVGITGLFAEQQNLTFSRNLVLSNGTGGYAVLIQNGWSGYTMTLSGAISGNGNFRLGKNYSQDDQSVSQAFKFTGDMSLFTGRIETDPTTTYAKGGNLTFGNGATQALGAFTINWTPYGGDSDSAGYVIFNHGNATTTFNGKIEGATKIKKQGAGSLTLSGSNDYTGGTTVEAGTLVASSTSAFGAGALTVNANAAVSVATGTRVSLGSGAMTIYGKVVAVANSGITTTGNVTFGSNAEIDVTGLQVSDAFTMSCGSMTEDDVKALLHMSHARDNYTVTVADGTATITFFEAGAALNLIWKDDDTEASKNWEAATEWTIADNDWVGGATSTNAYSCDSLKFAGTGVYSVGVVGAHVAQNFYVDSGTYAFSAGEGGLLTIENDAVVGSGATMEINSDLSVSAANGILVAESGVVKFNSCAPSYAVTGSSINGVGKVVLNNIGSECSISKVNLLSGTISVEKTGAGTVAINQAQNYTGGTTLNGGTLKIGNAQALGTGGLTINDGAIDLNGNSITVSTLTASTVTLVSSSTAGTMTVSGNVDIGSADALTLSIGTGATLAIQASRDMTLKLSELTGNLKLIANSIADLPTIEVEGEDVIARNVSATGVLLFQLKKEGEKTTLVPVLPRNGEYIWMPIGDSITEGEDNFENGGYRKRMWDSFRDDGLNVRSVGFRNGHKGTTAPESEDQWAWHNGIYSGCIVPVEGQTFNRAMQYYSIETELEICGYPDVITIMIGINDLANSGKSTPEEKVAEVWTNLAAYVKKVAELRPDSAVVVSTLIPSGRSPTDVLWSPFNDRMRLAKENGETPFNLTNVYFADMAKDAFNNTYTSTYYNTDNLHPNRAGSLILGRAFASRVEEVLAERKTTPAKIVAVHNEEGTEATEGTEGTQPTIHIRFSKPLSGFSAAATLSNGTKTITLTDWDIDADKCLVIGSITSGDEEAFTTHADWTLSVNGTASDLDGNTINSFEDFAKCDIAKSGAAAHVPDDYIEDFHKYKVYNLPENANDSSIVPNTLESGVVDNDKVVTEVAFYMELKRPGKSPQFVWTSMDASAFGHDPDKMGIPTASSGTIQNFNVGKFNVYGNRGNFTNVKGGMGIIEFTPYTYNGNDKSEGHADIRANALGWNDNLGTSTSGWGCMQVFSVANKDNPCPLSPYAQTLFAYNCFAADRADDLGIGTMVTHHTNAGGASGQITTSYDWTYIGSNGGFTTLATTAYEKRTLEVWVKTATVTNVLKLVDDNGTAVSYVVETDGGNYSFTVAEYNALGLTLTPIQKTVQLVDKIVIKTIVDGSATVYKVNDNATEYTKDEYLAAGFISGAVEILEQSEPCVLNDDLTAFTNVTIGAKVTVPRSKLQASLAILKGSGILDLEGGVSMGTINNKSEWQGAVVLSGSGTGNDHNNVDLSQFGKVILKGYTGFFKNWASSVNNANNDYPIATNDIELQDTATDYAFKNGAWAGGTAYTAEFAGKITGTGTFYGYVSDGNQENFLFSGDLTEFTGTFKGNDTLGSGKNNSLTLGNNLTSVEEGAETIQLGSFKIDWKEPTASTNNKVYFNYGVANVEYAGQLVSGRIVKNGSGNLKLKSASSDFAGTMTVSAGALEVGNIATLGTASVTVNSGATLNISSDADANGKLASGSFTIDQGATVQYKGVAVPYTIENDGLYLSSSFNIDGEFVVKPGSEVNSVSAVYIDERGDLVFLSDYVTVTEVNSTTGAVTAQFKNDVIDTIKPSVTTMAMPHDGENDKIEFIVSEPKAGLYYSVVESGNPDSGWTSVADSGARATSAESAATKTLSFDMPTGERVKYYKIRVSLRPPATP